MEYVSKEVREVMLGYPKVLVCDAGASGPKPSLTAEASGHSQRGFSSTFVALCLCVCHHVTSTRDSSKPKKHKIACMQCMVLCVYICVCTCTVAMCVSFAE